MFVGFARLHVFGNWNTTRAQIASKSYLVMVQPFCVLDTDINNSFRYSFLKTFYINQKIG